MSTEQRTYAVLSHYQGRPEIPEPEITHSMVLAGSSEEALLIHMQNTSGYSIQEDGFDVVGPFTMEHFDYRVKYPTVIGEVLIAGYEGETVWFVFESSP